MRFDEIKFEMKYQNPDDNTVALYFKAPSWQLYELKELERKMMQYSNANGMLVCLQFKDHDMKLKDCVTKVAPSEDGVPYEWINVKLGGAEIATLINTYEKGSI